MTSIASPNVHLKVPTEHREQANLIRSLQTHTSTLLWENVYAVPNGGKRGKAEAGKFKAEGVNDGVPDLVLDVPRGPFHGFRCEMKRQDATPSHWKKNQREWAARLIANGYLSVLGLGSADAFPQFLAYWNLGPFDPNCVVDMSLFRMRLDPKASRVSK